LVCTENIHHAEQLNLKSVLLGGSDRNSNLSSLKWNKNFLHEWKIDRHELGTRFETWTHWNECMLGQVFIDFSEVQATDVLAAKDSGGPDDLTPSAWLMGRRTFEASAYIRKLSRVPCSASGLDNSTRG